MSEKINLLSITLRNWRGEKERTTTFNTEGQTIICGDNGLGKSRHFDACCWLLFGKDSLDRKDFELRTYDKEHNVLHRCECSVEAVLSKAGEVYTLKREYKEKWVKPRGQVEEVFSGNVTECTWNGVPLKVNEFNARVSELLIDETVFKMITNPRFFTEKMKWQQQRELLLQMAGTKSDKEIAADNEDFKVLLDTLNGKSLTDFRKELSVKKKRFKGELLEIQPRIDQTQKMMPEIEDWNALSIQIEQAETELATLSEQSVSLQKRNDAKVEHDKQIAKQIYDLEMQRQKIEQEELTRLRVATDDKNKERKRIEAILKDANEKLTQHSIERKRDADQRISLNKRIEELNDKLNSLRNQWKSINASEYTDSGLCPCCGQRLPEEKIAEAYNLFVNNKTEQLRLNNEEGKALVAQRDQCTEQLSLIKEDATHEEAINAIKQHIAENYELLSKHPLVQAPTSIDSPTPEMLEIDKQLSELKAQMQGANNTIDDDNVLKIEERRSTLNREIAELKSRLKKRGEIDKAKEEISRLEEAGRELSQSIATIEKQEYTATQFTKKKIEDCEERINSMFSIVKFQLFDYTQEGNEFEVCTPIVNGTPYAVANTASQINAGLDIINTLCKFNNICAPVFIDGAESVNHYIDIPSQMILLQVTKDKQLVIK